MKKKTTWSYHRMHPIFKVLFVATLFGAGYLLWGLTWIIWGMKVGLI